MAAGGDCTTLAGGSDICVPATGGRPAAVVGDVKGGDVSDRGGTSIAEDGDVANGGDTVDGPNPFEDDNAGGRMLTATAGGTAVRAACGVRGRPPELVEASAGTATGPRPSEGGNEKELAVGALSATELTGRGFAGKGPRAGI